MTVNNLMACPHCGTTWADEKTCEDHFHQMLYWEHEDQAKWVVHQYMVLCYHLQHPHLYSPETLHGSMLMLRDFLERGVTTQQMRQRNAAALDSGKRKYKITGTPERYGIYEHPVHWTMTVKDVVDRGVDAYIDSVQLWARATLDALRASSNFPTKSN